MLLFSLLSAILAAVIAGILPAYRASRLDPIQVLKGAGPRSSAGAGERRLLRTVTMAQTAMTLALLVGAGLLIRTMMNLARVESGFETRYVLTMSVTAVQGQWEDFHHRALERVSALPGVEQAAFAWGVPLTGNNWPGFLRSKVSLLPQRRATGSQFRCALPLKDTFNCCDLPLIEGRDIRSSDDRKAPAVAVVNKAFADRYFPGTSAIGRKFWTGGRTARQQKS